MSYGTTHNDADVAAVIIDVGSNSTKGGLSGQDSPTDFFSSAVGTWEDEGGGKAFAVNRRELWHSRHRQQLPFDLEYPVVQGKVDNWECLEKVWERVLGVGGPRGRAIATEEHPMVIVEANLVSQEQREGTAQRAFEKHQSPALHLAKTAVCSCIAANKSSGLVLEVGGGISTCTPVFDGKASVKDATQSALAGDFLTDMLAQRVASRQEVVPAHQFRMPRKRDAQGDLKTSAIASAASPADYGVYMQRMTFQGIKETLCQLSEREITKTTRVPGLSARLPDGKEVELQKDRFSIPEMLLKGVGEDPPPVAVGPHCKEMLSLPQLIEATVSKFEDEEDQRKLYTSVVVCGGSSLFAKMDPRLRSFIEDKWRLVPGKRIISSPSAPMQPTYYQRWSSWLGASVMSSYSGFLPMWVSKQEYEEHGFGILMKRCP